MKKRQEIRKWEGRKGKKSKEIRNRRRKDEKRKRTRKKRGREDKKVDTRRKKDMGREAKKR